MCVCVCMYVCYALLTLCPSKHVVLPRVSTDSVFCIVTSPRDWKTYKSCFDSQQEHKIILLCEWTEQTVEPSMSFIQGTPVLNRSKCEVDGSHSLVAGIRFCNLLKEI